MKRLLVLIAAVLTLTIFGGALADSDVTINVDGKKVYFDTQPIMVEDRVMAPFRFVGEKIGADVYWYPDEQRVKMVKGDNTAEFIVGESKLWLNGKETEMDVSAMLYEGRTLIPIRFAAEALGGFVCWDSEEKTAEILTEQYSLTIGNQTIKIGDTIADISNNNLSYNRIDRGIDRLDWYVFNKDYGKFAMAGVLDGTVVSILTACTDFKLSGSYKNSDGVEYFTDENSKVYGIWIGKKYSDPNVVKENWKNVQKEINMQSRDFVNALRYSKGLVPLEVDDALSKTSYSHSTDMASRNYLGHTGSDGSTPWTRYSASGGTNFACGENISGGWFSAFENFDAWYNSEPHRKNMLNSDASYIGHGFAYDAGSIYKYYLTQMFSYKQ